jgi:hypothetical protein
MSISGQHWSAWPHDTGPLFSHPREMQPLAVEMKTALDFGPIVPTPARGMGDQSATTLGWHNER